MERGEEILGTISSHLEKVDWDILPPSLQETATLLNGLVDEMRILTKDLKAAGAAAAATTSSPSSLNSSNNNNQSSTCVMTEEQQQHNRFLEEEEEGGSITATTTTNTVQRPHEMMKNHPSIKKLQSIVKSRSPKHRHLMETHEAITSGNINAIGNHFSSMMRRMERHLPPPRHNSALAAATTTRRRRYDSSSLHRKLTLQDQCKDLVKELKEYSLYDLFMVTFRDDIDEDNGDFDDDADFRDENFLMKAKEVQILLNGMGDDDDDDPGTYSQEDCISLLKIFHFNVENNELGTTEFFGSSVNDILRKEIRSSRYVSLESIKNHDDPQFRRVADILFEDIFACSLSLHEKLADPGEKFPLLEYDGNADIPRVPHGLYMDQHGAPKMDGSYYRREVPNILGALFAKENERFHTPYYNDRPADENYYDVDLIQPKFTELLIDQGCNEKLVEMLYDMAENDLGILPRSENDTRLINWDDNRFVLSAFYPFGGLRVRCNEDKCWVTWVKRDSEFDEVLYETIDNDKCELKAVESFGGWATDPRFDKCPIAKGETCPNNAIIFKNLPTPWSDGSIDLYTGMLFGDEPRESVATICRIAEEAENSTDPTRENLLPGYCCLDRAYDISRGDDWGTNYECSQDCNTIGPLFSSISEGACNIFGGSFCRYARDCSPLIECINATRDSVNETIVDDDTGIVINNTEHNQVLYDYLNNVPEVENTMSFDECARVREYLGFDPDYRFDEDICEDVELLKDYDNFRYANRYSSGGGGEDCEGCDGSDVLDTPDIPKYGSTEGQAWRASNFALLQVYQGFREFYDYLDGIECPNPCGDPTETICKLAKNFAIGAYLVVLEATRIVLETSEFSYDEAVGLSDYQMNEIYFHTMIVRGNMVKLWNKIDSNHVELAGKDGGLQGKVDKIDQEIEVIDSNVDDIKADVDELSKCRTTNIATGSEKRGYGCDGKDNDCNEVIDDCDEDTFYPVIEGSRVIEFCGGENHMFQSILDAKECVGAHISAYDDCYGIDLSYSEDLVSTDSCTGETWTITVQAKEKTCNKTTEAVFNAFVHDVLQAPSCDFPQGARYIDPILDISKAEELCSGRFFQSVNHALFCVQKNIVAFDAANKCRHVSTSFETAVENLPSDLSSCTQTMNITVTTAIDGCIAEARKTVKSMLVLVDSNIVTSICEFHQGPDLPPILDTSHAIELCQNQNFLSEDEAENCIMTNSVATDAAGNCRPIETIVATTESGDSPCKYHIDVTAKIKGCDAGNLKTISSPITVLIDDTEPIAYCAFNKTELEKKGSGAFNDPGFAYAVHDDCGMPLQIKVETFSNEVEDTNRQTMIHLYEKREGQNMKVGMYVACTYCPSKNGNGDCAIAEFEDRRVYIARVTATNAVGLRHSAECYVEILPKGSIAEISIAENETHGIPSKYFLLETYNDPEYIPDGDWFVL